jgi:hypothetical protein
MSDHPDVDLYNVSRNKKNQNHKVHSARGTSSLEGFHKHLRRLFPGSAISPANALLLLLGKVHCWNLRAAISRRGAVDHGTHDTAVILRLQGLDNDLKEELETESKYRMPNPNHFEHNPNEHLGLSRQSFYAKGANFVDNVGGDGSSQSGGDDGGDSSQDDDYYDDSSDEDEEDGEKISAAEAEFHLLCGAEHGCGILLPNAPSDDEMALVNHLLTISAAKEDIHKGWMAALEANSKLKGAERKALRYANANSISSLLKTVERRKNQRDSLAPFKEAAKTLQKVHVVLHVYAARPTTLALIVHLDRVHLTHAISLAHAFVLLTFAGNERRRACF